jgi:hypothetical protein
MLHTVEVWVDSVPGLEVGGASGFGKAPWAWLLLAASGIDAGDAFGEHSYV